MATPYQTLLEELEVAKSAGDLDKVTEIEAMIQLHFGNNPPGGDRIGRIVSGMGGKKGGTVKSSSKKTKKGSTLRGVGIAKRGIRKAKIT